MPKRPTADYASDDGFVEDGEPQPKKSKKSSTNKRKTSTQTDDSDDPYWELSANGNRRVTINEFKGMTLINIREYYESNGKKLPGKKGISLQLEQFTALVESLPQIEKALAQKKKTFVRPNYDGASPALDKPSENPDVESEGDEEDVDEEVKVQKKPTKNAKNKKKNYEATSEEDE